MRKTKNLKNVLRVYIFPKKEVVKRTGISVASVYIEASGVINIE